MYNVAGIFVQEHVPIMWSVFIPVFLVTLLITVGLDEHCMTKREMLHLISFILT